MMDWTMKKPGILLGLKEIARYLRISRKTAWWWIQFQAFPACKTPPGMWMASTSLVDAWILARH